MPCRQLPSTAIPAMTGYSFMTCSRSKEFKSNDQQLDTFGTYHQIWSEFSIEFPNSQHLEPKRSSCWICWFRMDRYDWDSGITGWIIWIRSTSTSTSLNKKISRLGVFAATAGGWALQTCSNIGVLGMDLNGANYRNWDESGFWTADTFWLIPPSIHIEADLSICSLLSIEADAVTETSASGSCPSYVLTGKREAIAPIAPYWQPGTNMNTYTSLYIPTGSYSPRFAWGGRPHRRLFWPTQTYIQKIRQNPWKHSYLHCFLQFFHLPMPLANSNIYTKNRSKTLFFAVFLHFFRQKRRNLEVFRLKVGPKHCFCSVFNALASKNHSKYRYLQCFFISVRFSLAGSRPKWPKIPFQYHLKLRHPKIVEKSRKHHQYEVSVRNRFCPPQLKLI